MNRIVNAAFITMALSSTIQCGWGAGTQDDPIVLSTLIDITDENNSSHSINEFGEDVYTLIAPKNGTKYYKIEPSDSNIYLKKNFVIPKNAQVTYKYGNYYYLYIGDNRDGYNESGSLTNNGTFKADSPIYLYDNSQLINNGTFTPTRFVQLYDNSKIINEKNGKFYTMDDLWCREGSNVTVENYGYFENVAESQWGIDLDDNSTLTIINYDGAQFINNNAICTWQFNNINITFQGSGEFINKGTDSKSGEIYLSDGDSSITISQETILTFGDYGKFYIAENSTHNVTLNGTIEINSTLAGVNLNYMNFFSGVIENTVGEEIVTVDKNSYGFIDMSPLRPYPEEYSDNLKTSIVFSNHDFFTFGDSQSLPNIKLPFNCKFKTTLSLGRASSVYYTVLKTIDKVGIDNNIIQKCGDTYGDYACDLNLGVSLPKIDGEIDRSKLHVTEETQGNVNMSLSEVTNDTTDYNILGAGYYLKTDDLDDTIHNISGDTIYYFGFIGTTPIQISGNGTAIFMGDNSKYGKEEDDTWSEDISTEVSLPAEVEFGANNSLFPFSYTYGHGTFTAGNFINTILAGAEVKFTSGFTLGVAHTLVVKGTLIG